METSITSIMCSFIFILCFKHGTVGVKYFQDLDFNLSFFYFSDTDSCVHSLTAVVLMFFFCGECVRLESDSSLLLLWCSYKPMYPRMTSCILSHNPLFIISLTLSFVSLLTTEFKTTNAMLWTESVFVQLHPPPAAPSTGWWSASHVHTVVFVRNISSFY